MYCTTKSTKDTKMHEGPVVIVRCHPARALMSFVSFVLFMSSW
jgi:hypothetical protein